MRNSSTTFSLLAALVFATGLGCTQSESRSKAGFSPPPPPPLAPPADTVARVHWVGKMHLGIEAGAYYFMRIWGLPETARLQSQTLDKLCVAPWRLLRGEASVSNAPAALLRPLLDDVLQDEIYGEVSQPTNQPAQMVFAIRLSNPDALQWETNVAAVLESLTGIRPAPNGRHAWRLKKHHPPNLIELTRVGEWTVLGAAEDENALLDQVTARIRRYGVPYYASPKNCWLEADFDLKRVADALGLGGSLPADLPKVSAAVTGDGGNVIVHGTLDFPTPLRIDLAPWTVPTNLIREPLSSFTAVRGVSQWLSKWKRWKDLQFGEPPDQFWSWAHAGSPYQTYFAAPLPDASNRVYALTERFLDKGNSWLASRGYVNFERLQDANGVAWGNLPTIRPFIESVDAEHQGIVYGGLVPDGNSTTNVSVALFYHPTFAELLQDMEGRTNLVWYHWELTGPRVDSLLYLGQFLRLISRHAQLPMQSTGAAWLAALVPRGGNCETAITRTGPSQLSFERKSIVGLTALELHLLVDWLESPRFPQGSYTLLTPP